MAPLDSEGLEGKFGGKLELPRVEHGARTTEYRIDRIDDAVLIVFGESRTR